MVRNNSVRTRNNRLGDPLAVLPMRRCATLSTPARSSVCSPSVKLFDRKLVTYLNDDEVDALLWRLRLETWTGRRDEALLDLAVEAGLRTPELAGAQVLRRSSTEARTFM